LKLGALKLWVNWIQLVQPHRGCLDGGGELVARGLQGELGVANGNQLQPATVIRSPGGRRSPGGGGRKESFKPGNAHVAGDVPDARYERLGRVAPRGRELEPRRGHQRLQLSRQRRHRRRRLRLCSPVEAAVVIAAGIVVFLVVFLVDFLRGA
jgi:hypothetical protein